MSENQHRSLAEQAFEEALAKLQQLPSPAELAETEAGHAFPDADGGDVWEEAGADLEAFFAQQEERLGEE